jgi:hypothetical protein
VNELKRDSADGTAKGKAAGIAAQKPAVNRAILADSNHREKALSSKRIHLWMWIVSLPMSFVAIGIIPAMFSMWLTKRGWNSRCPACGKWWARVADAGTFLRAEAKTGMLPWTIQEKDKNIHDSSGRIIGYTSRDNHEARFFRYRVETWRLDYHCCFCGHHWEGEESGEGGEFQKFKAASRVE